jgi:phosphomethylpyrimidine synthase
MSGTNGSNGTTTVKPRAEWITRRREEAARSGDSNMSQMHFARKGLLTEEMLFVAEREKVAPELIRDEVAA